MGLFRRFFSPSNDLPALRKAVAHQRHAEALSIGRALLETGPADAEHTEIEALIASAGDALARKNLDEAQCLQNNNQHQEAQELLQLAAQQASTDEIKEQVRQALANLTPAPLPAATPAATCSGCSSCSAGTAPSSPPATEADDADFETRLELILAGYPAALRERYQQKSPEFLQAFMLTHEEKDVEALKQFGKLPAGEQDDLFDFEAGSAMARLGEPAKACDALYSAIKKNPSLTLAAEALVTLLVGMKKQDLAVHLLHELLGKECDPAFCHGQLLLVHHSMNDAQQALRHGKQALALGEKDAHLVLLTAMLLEANNEYEEAEKAYSAIPAAAGCGGNGINLYLAEFLLRRKRDLKKILDTFNHACHLEPDNPRWSLRVAQTYLALGWEKQGKEMLNKVVADPRLMDELRSEGQALLAD